MKHDCARQACCGEGGGPCRRDWSIWWPTPTIPPGWPGSGRACWAGRSPTRRRKRWTSGRPATPTPIRSPCRSSSSRSRSRRPGRTGSTWTWPAPRPRDQAELVSRARDLGGSPADIGQGDVPWVVMADPEGNEFCVLEPRDAYRDTGPVAAILTDCADPAALARFWAGAAGWPVARTEDDLVGLRSPAGTGPYLEFLRGSPTARRSRTGSTRTWRPTAARIPPPRWRGCAPRARPSRTSGQGGDVSWTVLADPEGNEFCVLSPR